MSSLFGIYTAQRSLQNNQAALNIVNNNIANMSTPGYTKQRIEFSEKVVNNPGANPLIAAQNGAGAQIDSITRNRDSYYDSYYRSENSSLSYYTELNNNNTLVSDVVNELSQSGISTSLANFYDAAQQVSLNPTDLVARTSLVQRAKDLCDNFNNTSQQLTQVETTLVGDPATPTSLTTSKLNITVNDLNTKLSQLANLNKQIGMSSTAHGNSPNNLLDQRDSLLDDISKLIPISVTQKDNNLISLSMNGTELVTGAAQNVKFQAITNTSQPNPPEPYDPAIVKIIDYNTGNDIVSNANSTFTSGQIGGIIQTVRTDYNNPNDMSIPNILNGLDSLANQFATAINNIQTSGSYIVKATKKLNDTTLPVPDPNDPNYDPDAPLNPVDPLPVNFFLDDSNDITNIKASSIKVNSVIINDPYQIAAAKSTNINETGDGSNALTMAQFRNTNTAGLDNTTTEGYLAAFSSKIGVHQKSIIDKFNTQTNIVNQAENRRESTMGVSLDEELTDLVKYQRAYEASAKVFNTVDQSIQTIINLAR